MCIYLRTKYLENLSHISNRVKNEIAKMQDFLKLSLPQVLKQFHIQRYFLQQGCTPGLATNLGLVAGSLAALRKHSGCRYFQIAQGTLAEAICRLGNRPSFGRCMLNKLLRILHNYEFIRIPNYRTCPSSPPKIIEICDRLLDRFLPDSVNEGHTSVKVRLGGDRRPSRVFKEHSIPVAESTLFDRNHVKALEKTVGPIGRMPKTEYKLLFYAQLALPDQYVALKFFTQAIQDSEWMALFGRALPWNRKRAVKYRYGQGDVALRRLTEQDRQLLYWFVRTTKDIKKGILAFVEFVNRRRSGDEFIHRFMANWSEFTVSEKAGQIRTVLPCEEFEPEPETDDGDEPTLEMIAEVLRHLAGRNDGEVTALGDEPTIE